MAKASRTVTRDEPAARAAPPPAVERAPERDPNAILTRDGRAIDLGRVRRQLAGDDRYDLKRMGVTAPKGWVYEWRTHTVKGTPWVEAQADDEAAGWTPVPAERHDGLIMPRGHVGPILLGGLMLKERDERLTAMSRHYQKSAADRELFESRNMAGMMQKHNPAAADIFDQGDPAAVRGTGVKIERIPMGDPQKNYTYTLDE